MKTRSKNQSFELEAEIWAAWRRIFEGFGGKGVRGSWVFIGGVWRRKGLANATNPEIFPEQVRYLKNSCSSWTTTRTSRRWDGPVVGFWAAAGPCWLLATFLVRAGLLLAAGRAG